MCGLLILCSGNLKVVDLVELDNEMTAVIVDHIEFLHLHCRPSNVEDIFSERCDNVRDPTTYV